MNTCKQHCDSVIPYEEMCLQWIQIRKYIAIQHYKNSGELWMRLESTILCQFIRNGVFFLNIKSLLYSLLFDIFIVS